MGQPGTAAFSGKYLSVTSLRRDGAGVSTPVWFVSEGGRLLIETDGDSYKVKRIRANPSVTVASCTVRGRLNGESFPARAEVLPVADVARVEQLLAHKYRIDMLGMKPIRWAQAKLHLGRKRGVSVIVAITPE